MRLLHLVIVVLSSACLAACGTKPPSPNSPPTVTIMASGQVMPLPPAAELSGRIGGEISLNGMPSTDPDGDALSFRWTLTTKPPGSKLALAPSAAVITFTPDTFGTFSFILRVSDTNGAFTERTVPIVVNHIVPNQAIVITPTLAALPTVQPTHGMAVGSAVVLDATGSRDPNGDPLILTSTLTERPTGSDTVLSSNGKVARFIADTEGLYRVTVRPKDSAGALVASTTYVFDARNTASNTILLADAISGASAPDPIHASVGFEVMLDGTDDSSPESGSVTRTWTLTSKPNFSTAQLRNPSGLATQFAPDVFGDYVVQLTVAHSSGVSDSFRATIRVENTQPIADIIAMPNALASAQAMSVPIGTPVTLRGSTSFDADGERLTYDWSVVAAPSGSTAAPATPDQADTLFTPDLGGAYAIRLRVTDPEGAFSERSLIINVGNAAPVAVVNRDRVNVVAGATVTVSAARSFDPDLDPLTYSWMVEVAPPSSAATGVTTTTPDFSFIADLPGLYLASVTVNDGRNSMISRVVVRALPATSDSVVLPFVPIEARYDKHLDKMIIAARNPDALKIVDPRSGLIETAILRFPVKSFSLSPDGLLAAVLHEGRITLVDLSTAQELQSSFTQESHTDVFLQNDGVAYLIGGTDGQVVRPGVRIIDTRLGMTLPNPRFPDGEFFFGVQQGVFADRKNQALFSSISVSPQSISTFTIDPVQHTVVTAGDTRYPSGVGVATKFYLSEDQQLLFTSAGTFFDVDTREFVGSLTLTGGLASLTQSARNDEALVLQRTSLPFDRFEYPSVYKRFFGPLLQADSDIALPTIHGQQSFGIQIFHDADDDTVILVQTGGAEALTPGLRYHVIVR